MADEEMEKFQISDYDLENEFNVNRPRRKLTKEQQMLGIWARDSSEEEEERPSFGKAPKNYSAPVNFVAGGIQQAGKPKEEKKEYNSDDDEEDNDNRRIKNSSSESEEEIPKSRSRSSFNFNTDNDIAGLRKKKTSANPNLTNAGIGSWEAHTKGFGAKILLQFGYEPGKGLGKQLQGISVPVEARVRKGRGAIGAYGSEKTPKLAEDKAKIEEKIIDQKKSNKNLISQWRKNEKGEKNKMGYSYRSVDEVLEDGKTRRNKNVPSINTEIVKCKVTDMTTPEQRVFSSYHALGKRQLQPGETLPLDKKTKGNFSLPELQHNLDMLVDICEQNIIQNDKKTKYLGDRVIALEAEKHTLTKIVDQHAQMIGTLENVLAMVNKLLDRNSDMSLKETAEAFKILQEKHFEEYKMYDLGDLAISFIIPKIKEYLINWSPLTQPELPLQMFKEWKNILEYDLSNLHKSMNSYDQLVWNAWMPSVRIAIQMWPCRQPDNLIDLLELWLPLIPTWILDNILDMIVLPKLTFEVEEWNPLTDTIPIHTWIHPWLPLMKNKMDTLIYPVIRRKLASALGAWHPSDRSARLMLQPWSQVFARGDMDAFLVKNILPKLQIALSEFVINPHQQHLDQWNWIYDWRDLIPNHTMASLLDKFFFPKWLQVLGLWLNHSPNYEEVTNWYTGWKSMLSEKLLAEPIIKEHFRKALEMMNRAVSIPQGLQPGSVEQVSYLTTLERSQPQVPQISQPRMDRLAEAVRTASQMPQGFKDLVQKKCEERGILFMPLANRYREAKQIYKIGNVQAYIDSDILFVCHNGLTWLPTNLNTLLDTAEIS